VTSSGLDLTGLLRPVRENNAFEETVERLLTVIKLGFVGPGERFPAERELAAQLGISRLTLREAIRELQQAGYVESRRGRSGGTFVTGRPPAPDRGELRRLAREDGDKLADALAFRLALETGSADALAMLVAQSSARQDTPQVLAARLAGVNGASPQDYRRLDTLFHLSIAELTGSTLLTAACADARPARGQRDRDPGRRRRARPARGGRAPGRHRRPAPRLPGLMTLCLAIATARARPQRSGDIRQPP